MRTLVFVLPLALVGCAGSPTDGETGSELVGDATAGATVYTTNCTGCHGADGEGDTAPGLAEIAAEFDDAAIGDILRNGTDGGMPSFAQLSDQEIADVTAYVRTFAP